MLVNTYKSINSKMLGYIKSLQDPKEINRLNFSRWHSNPYDYPTTNHEEC